MTEIRILHVDDEQDIREVVELSLGLDPDFAVHSCASGREALSVAADWAPDIILLDVMMPVMDGPATLAELRRNAATAGFPVVFMTARTQARETDRFRALGAVGVIQKPFDPMTLAASLRAYAQPPHDPLEHLRLEFLGRVRRDAAMLLDHRKLLEAQGRASGVLNQIKTIVHALSGASGIYGFAELSDVAAEAEDAVTAELRGERPPADTDRSLDCLMTEMQQRCSATFARGLQEVD